MKQEDWQNRWKDRNTPWDLGAPHPRSGVLIQKSMSLGLLSVGDSILIPGCGRAHDAAPMVRAGFRVKAFDYVGEAVAEAKAEYGHLEGLSLEQADALKPPKEDLNRYAAVFDRAMLCALQPADRSRYLRACASCLQPGGVFLTLPFTGADVPEDHRGPPFILDEVELLEIFSPLFSLVWAQTWQPERGSGFLTEELMCLWRKKDG